jgi:hypothetical protein
MRISKDEAAPASRRVADATLLSMRAIEAAAYGFRVCAFGAPRNDKVEPQNLCHGVNLSSECLKLLPSIAAEFGTQSGCRFCGRGPGGDGPRGVGDPLEGNRSRVSVQRC